MGSTRSKLQEAINTVVDGVIQTSLDEGGAFGVPGGAQTGWRVDTGYNADTGARTLGSNKSNTNTFCSHGY